MDLLEQKHIKTSRGLTYRYYVSPTSTSDPTKPALLLCHGWPDSASLWQYLVPSLLRTQHRLLIPDLLGSGGTSKPTSPSLFEISKMTQDITDILSHERITQKLIPIGHDWGSYFAQRVYLLNRERMVGIVTLNVAWMAPRKEEFNLEDFNAQATEAVGYPVYAYWELFADPEVGKVMDGKLESVWHAIHGAEDEWMKKLFCTKGAMREFIEEGRTDVPLKRYALDKKLKNEWMAEKRESGMTSQCAWYRALKENFQLETESKLDGRVTTPYLFIGCDGDAVCRTDFIGLSLQAGLVKKEDSTVKELECGHWSPYEKPEEVSQAIVEWLESNGL